MIRNYSNNKIYKNLAIVKILSIIAIIFALFGLTIDAVISIYYSVEIKIDTFVSFYLLSLVIPFLQLSITRQSPIKETKFNNDFSNLITIIVLSLFPLLPYTIYKLSGSNEQTYLPNILVYISDGLLIHNCMLIKREWNENPPEFYSKKQALIMQKKSKQIQNRNMEQYKTLIEICGIKFFIKYYNQIRRLPLRDVTVSENFSSDEREDRLLAAKKIIDTGLTEFTLTEIIRDYSDVLDESEIIEAKSILSEIQRNTNSQSSVDNNSVISISKKEHPSYDDAWDN